MILKKIKQILRLKEQEDSLKKLVTYWTKIIDKK